MKHKTPEKRDTEDLNRAVSALKATSHNPVEWSAIIRFVAPIVARITARYVMKVIGRKLNKRISSKVREETVLLAADHLAQIAIKRTTKTPAK